ncbi:MAG: CoA transferase [Rhizobiales bacterium]|nr:CoA transferase [Hyphomicrobiales bacterium]
MSGPLTGLRVLELARILAGPWAGQILADLGADVIKVERKGAGDDTRGWGPPFMPAADGGHLGAAYFHATNRGKRSIEIDFDSEEGRDVVRRLAARSDVLIENFKVGGLAKFGLDYQSLSALNPGLIYCSVTGFGQDGPYAPRAGYDLLVQGMGGIMSVTGLQDGEPMRIGIPVADIFTGVYSAVGILAALAEREKTGKGTLVDTALLDTQSGVLANQALSYFATGTAPGRIGNAHPVVVPYQVFPAKDGFVIIACGNDAQFVKLCGALGAPEVGRDPKYKTNADRVVNRETLIPSLCEVTATLTRAEILAKLDAVNVPAGPINNLDDVFADPQVIHRKMQLALPSEAAPNGTIPGVRTPIVIGGEAMASPRPAPRLGEHTDEILREIGEA